MTNDIARSVIITQHFLTTVKFVHLDLNICTFFERVSRRMLLGYIVAKACTSPRNSTWFTRPVLLVRGLGHGDETSLLVAAGAEPSFFGLWRCSFFPNCSVGMFSVLCNCVEI